MNTEYCGPKCWIDGQTDGQINQPASLSFGPNDSGAKRKIRRKNDERQTNSG